MEINFQKQDSLQDTITIVKQLFARFNMNYGNIIDMKLIDDAINNIVIVKDDLSNVPSKIKKRYIYGAMGIFFENKIYVKKDVSIYVLIHEIIHFITKNTRGLAIPLATSYSEEEIVNNTKKYGEDRFVEQIDQLNEAMTKFIVELIIPEIQQKDAYEFGANALRIYSDKLSELGLDKDFLFLMYFNGDMEAIKKFKDSFGDKFDELLDNLERWHNCQRYIMNPQMKPTIDYDNISAIIEEAVNSIGSR